MYAAVPASESDGGAECSRSISVTRPKSRIFTRPSRVTSTFDGLRSRWSSPRSCIAATPSASCGSTRRSRATSSVPSGSWIGTVAAPGSVPLGVRLPGEVTPVADEREVPSESSVSPWRALTRMPRTHLSRLTPSMSSIVKKS